MLRRRFAAILALSAWTAAAAAQSERVVLVDEGAPLRVERRGPGWTSSEGALRATGVEHVLVSDVVIGPGDAHVRARLTLTGLGRTAASFVIAGSHVGFDGEGGVPFVEGPLFGGRTRALDVDARVEEGQPFTLDVRRNGDTLRVSLDDELIVLADLRAVPFPRDARDGLTLGSFGLRPWRATMAVESFTAEGDLRRRPTRRALFTAGEGGYDTYRIPALCTTTEGTVLAFCEGRRDGRGDSGDIDLLLRRSTDGGRNWGPIQVVWDDGPNTCGNPCPVVDRTTGAVHLLMTRNLGGDHEAEIIAGTSRGTRTVWLCATSDDGVTWTKPEEITSSVKRSSWTWFATGPGVGIQLRRSVYEDRLVVPCDHIEADTRRAFSHVIISEDYGLTWRLAGRTPTDGVNECQVVELGDGRLMLNMRNYNRGEDRRKISISDDGGETWGPVTSAPALVEPICQASFLRLDFTPDEPERLAFRDPPPIDRVLFSNPASRDARTHMTVRLSLDDAKTWPHAQLLHPGPSAYSSLSVLPDGTILCLYEAGELHPYETISLSATSVEAISDGEDTLSR